MHPAIGVLHVSHGNRPALTLDLMEEFRAPVIDRLVLRFQKTVTPKDFTITSYGCRLSDVTRAAFIRAFEDKLSEPLKRNQTTRRTWRDAIRAQSEQFAQCLHDPDQAYQPVRVR